MSHPHYYTAMADWADAFGAPVHIHELDREWVTQPSDRIHYWTGTMHLCACSSDRALACLQHASALVMHHAEG